MIKLKFINEKGSNACKYIMESTGIGRINKVGILPDILINYGVSGARKEKFFIKYPKTKTIPMINAFCGINKLRAIKLISDCGILTPKSKLSLSKEDKIEDWIEKRIRSYSGNGIQKARHRNTIKGKYYQQFIKNRTFELRIHAFSWLPKADWVALKRTGDKNTIAWNYSKGGHFNSISSNNETAIKAKKIAEDVLRVLHMEFGAIDFIVDSKNNIYFIEINSQPGMTGLSNKTYVKAFNKLNVMSKENIIKCFNH